MDENGGKWMTNVLLALIGGSLGVVVASGALALLIALGIVVRYVRITKTQNRIGLYEDSALLGTFIGGIWQLGQFSVGMGWMGVVIYGFFSGFFLGGWIIALGEVLNVFAIMLRRFKIEKGVSWIFFVMALGKMIGTLLFYGKGWWRM